MDVAAESPLRERMIFNIGARRSGTYWLQRIVTAHPSVGEVPSETHLLSHGIAPLLERFQHADRDSTEVGRVYVPRERLLAALRHLCDEVFREYLGPGQERVAERTPLHIFHLELISEVYPDAKFVHIIRDGRDVTRSIASQDWGPAEIADAATEWRDSVSAARHAGLPPDRYLEVRYETLLANPRSQIEQIYEWLGLPTAPEDLAHPLAESAREENVDRFGMGGVRTEKWRAAFDRRDLAAFDAIAGDLLEELGYPAAAGEPSSRGLLGRTGAIGSAITRRLRG